MNDLAERLDRAGYTLLPAQVPRALLDDHSESLAPGLQAVAGSRNLLAHPSCRAVAIHLKSQLVDTGLLGVDALAVQCILLDKTPEKNWRVAWHQDTSIPAAPGPGSDSMPVAIKEGEPYVQPSVAVLASLLAVRVHLDDCGADAGPLRVVPGSHCAGRLDDAQARALRETQGEVTCIARRGDALAMRPLLWHASSRARAPVRRRVLHFLFGPACLPQGLVWNASET